MSLKTKITTCLLISVASISLCFELQVTSYKLQVTSPTAQAETIAVENPLEYENVNDLATQIRSYLLYIVGGIAIVFIAVSGILYIVGGA
ncbi:MAG: hypothetical protein V1690_01630, partial [Candidatus Moraniibacteriota bacterium]